MKRILAALLASVLLVSQAWGISDQYKVLFGTGFETRANVTSTTNGTPFCFDDGRPEDFIFWMDADAVSGTTPTLDVKVQHSPDRKNWKDLEAFTQVTTTDGIQTFHQQNLTTHVMRCIRVVLTLGGTSPVYNVLVRGHYRLQGAK